MKKKGRDISKENVFVNGPHVMIHFEFHLNYSNSQITHLWVSQMCLGLPALT